ncbi:hypothetical protein [Simkania sp.]|uniref:hypothetical protein n=1 Tax=Simkania sp. TaxID=34094 RepID=UPI003B518A90
MFPKLITKRKDKFVQLLNRIVDSPEMTKILSSPPKEFGPVDDVMVTLKPPLKYVHQDGASLRNKRADTIRVQLSYQKHGWTFHAYPLIPGMSK